jgi:hypothetical protein
MGGRGKDWPQKAQKAHKADPADGHGSFLVAREFGGEAQLMA